MRDCTLARDTVHCSDAIGDHGMVCGTGGERIAWHNTLCDAFYDTAAAAGLAPFRRKVVHFYLGMIGG